MKGFVSASLFGAWLACGLPARAEDAGEPLPPADEIIRKFIERAAAVSTNRYQGAYVFHRTNITEEFGRKGRLTEREELLLRVTVRDDERTVELLAVDGRPATEKDRERELRRFGGKREHATRRERPDRSRPIDAYLTHEVLDRYDFKVAGREEVAGRTCYRVTFVPDGRDSRSDKLFERVLNALTGSFWIDAGDYQLARADIALGEKVSLWGGVLGGLEQMRLQIQRARSEDGVWRDQVVDARFVGRAVARHIDIRTQDFSSKPEPTPPLPLVAAE